MLLTRRRFLIGAGLIGSAAALAGGAMRTESVEVLHTTIHIPDLPSAFQDYCIGFISDIHLSVCSETARLEQTFSLLRAEKPDLILFGGDFIWLPDSPISQLALSIQARHACLRHYSYMADSIYSAIARYTQSLNPPDGMYGVLGNHDGWQAPEPCIKRLRDGNVRVLRNEQVEILRGSQRLQLVGFDDYWTGIPSIPPLSPRSRGNSLRVLLAHNPDYFSALLRRTEFEFDLGLAGHTHGGQVKLPGIGAISYNIFDALFGEGLVWFNRAHVYTTRGIGEVVVPIRINCPPEVSILTLSRT